MKSAKDTVFYQIESTIKLYRRYAQGQLKKVSPEITIDQTLVLGNLIDNADVTQKELSQFIFKDMASISRMLDLLEKHQFIVRTINPANRRRFTIKVTTKGKTIYDKLKPTVLENRKKALKGVTTKEINLLNNILQKISTNIQ